MYRFPAVSIYHLLIDVLAACGGYCERVHELDVLIHELLVKEDLPDLAIIS